MLDTGKTHWQTKEVIQNACMVVNYNKYMEGGEVDCNDQLMQYSAFNRCTVKWWEKTAFRMLNLAMVNAYILHSEWCASKNTDALMQTNFHINVIKQLVASTEKKQNYNVPGNVTEFNRLNGKHFIEKIPCDINKKQLTLACKVCNESEHHLDKSHGRVARKRPGRDSSFQCKTCKTALCVGFCFEICHTRKDFVKKYIDDKNV